MQGLISILLCLALMFAGCAHFRPQPIHPDQSAAALEARNLSDPKLKTFLQSPIPPDTSLPVSWDVDRLTGAAFFFRSELEQARAQWELARAEIRTAQARPNPTVTLAPGISANAPPATPPWIPLGTVDVPIETAGKRRLRTAAAEQREQSSRLKIIQLAWSIHSQVRSAVIDALAAQSRQALLTNQITVQRQIEQRIRQRISAGAVAQSELAIVRAAVSRLELDLANAQLESTQAFSRLAQALGLPRSAVTGLPIEFALEQPDFPAAVKVAELRQMALQGRADVRQALAAYAESELNLQLQIAKQYPDLRLSPGYQWDEGEHKWQLGLSFELPLLNRNQGPIAEAKAKRHEAAARVELLQLDVIHQIDEADARWRSAQQQLRHAEDLIGAQKDQLRNVQQQLDSGAADILELLNAQLQLLQAEQLRLDSLIRLQTASTLLEAALESPAPPFLERIFIAADAQAEKHHAASKTGVPVAK